jgi:cobaltochelatase CobT
MVNRVKTIQEALPIVAAAVGRKLGVRVKIGGSEAATNGDVIHLPSLPFDDTDVAAVAFGFLEHEAAHIRYTDQVECGSPFEAHIQNALEDIRIESALLKEYPGFDKNLAAVPAWLQANGKLAVLDQELHPAAVIGEYLFSRLRYEVLGQTPLADRAAQSENLLRSKFSAGVVTKLGSVVGQVPMLKSSLDSLNLASLVVSILKDESDPPKEEPPSKSDNESDDSGDESQEESSGPTPAQASNAQMALVAGESECGDDIGETLAQALSDQSAKASPSGGGGIGFAEESPDPGLGDSHSVWIEASKQTMALRARIQGLVQAARQVHERHGRYGARIDSRRVVKAYVSKDGKMFRKRSESIEVNTAVTLLLDRSGSMEDGKIEVARITALSTASALEGIRGVSVNVAAFPGVGSSIEWLAKFKQPLRSRASRFAALHASGGTPMTEALMWAVDQHLQRTETRHIILVVTDGQPNNVKSATETVRLCWAGGFEVYGIGIQVPNIGQVFPRSQCIGSVEELARAMFDLLQSAVTRRIAA